MCFSSSASLGAGAVLAVIGVASIRKAEHPSQVLFASIPLIFAVQQIAEGFLWLTLPNPEDASLQKYLTYVFLFFAEILWPVWVPIAFLFLEKNATRKRIQKILVIPGLMVGIYLSYCLFSFDVQAQITGHHITYHQNYPAELRELGIILYGIATILPPFFSHIKRMWVLGAAILLSYIITAIFYQHYILSVWCFFAAIISISIYSIMMEIKKHAA